ncbi:MAG: hypothetical protein Q7T55_16780, partial [Solirubrobacteraceae bacterium]|nr:hypothetical protein [Solirubrobacteraceae bacterium]
MESIFALSETLPVAHSATTPATPNGSNGSNGSSQSETTISRVITNRDWKALGIVPEVNSTYFHQRTLNDEKLLVCKLCHRNYAEPSFALKKFERKGIFSADANSTTSQKKHTQVHAADAKTPNPSTPEGMQPKITSFMPGRILTEVRTAQHQLVEAFAQLSLPMSLIEAPEMKPFFEAHQSITGIRSRKQITAAVIAEAALLKKKFLETIRCHCVCLCIDGGTINGQSFMNIIVVDSTPNCPYSFFWASVPCYEPMTAKWIGAELQKVILELERNE